MLVPLAGPDFPVLPNMAELRAVLLDLNIGLLPNFPAFAPAVALSLVVLMARAPRRLWFAEAAISAASAVIFLFSVTQTSNLDHGGTPDMSRYALWFVPLAIPLFRRLDTTCGTVARRAMVPVVIASAFWCVLTFRPSVPELDLTPTTLAGFVWQRFPALENPPPEIFIERLVGRDTSWRLPVTTADCSKMLLAGEDEAGMWPSPCPIARMPPRCHAPGALCYANRSSHGYDVVPVAVPSFNRHLEFNRDAVWGRSFEDTVRQIDEQFRWWELSLLPQPGPNVMLRANYGARAYDYQGPDRLLVFVIDPEPGAFLQLRVPGRMIGEFIELRTGRHLGAVLYTGEPWAAWSVAVPGSASAVLALRVSG